MTSEHEPATTADIAYGQTNAEGQTGSSQPAGDSDRGTPLLAEDRAEELQAEWTRVQADFVDRPRDAVEQADALVADVIQELARTFADERSSLEQQWDHGEDIDTEALRVALQRYRSFFHRLLAA